MADLEPSGQLRAQELIGSKSTKDETREPSRFDLITGSPSPCDSTAAGLSTGIRSGRHGLVLDGEPPASGRLVVEEPQAKGAGQRDVLRLADVEAFLAKRIDRDPARRTGRGKLFLDALGIDDVP